MVVLLAAPLLVAGAHVGAQSQAQSEISITTDDRVQAPGWWPTKSAAARSDFVGTATCAKCHEKQATTYIATPMAQASAPATYSQILQGADPFIAERPPYRYELARTNGVVNYSVTDGIHSLSTAVFWAFGLGRKGQTYVYQRNSAFYESRLSFYRTLQALDLTTGHNASTPDDLESALGRRMDADETRHCFACHTTASTINNRLDVTHLIPGITCEACHGPGARHVEAMRSGKIAEGRRAILNPSHLNPVASVDFCGACHRTYADVLQAGFTGVINARFQPYRLESSRCWRKGDPRLTCTACHNPHEELALDPSQYDEKCLSCHVAGEDARPTQDHPGNACPISTVNCVTCHMPQIDLPTMHAPFTDHRIRIVKPGTPYPN